MPQRKKTIYEKFYDDLNFSDKLLFDTYIERLINHVKEKSPKSQLSPLGAKEVIYKLLQRGYI